MSEPDQDPDKSRPDPQHCLQQQQTPTNLQSNNKQILGKLCNLQQVNVTSKCKKKVSLQELKKR